MGISFDREATWLPNQPPLILATPHTFKLLDVGMHKSTIFTVTLLLLVALLASAIHDGT